LARDGRAKENAMRKYTKRRHWRNPNQIDLFHDARSGELRAVSRCVRRLAAEQGLSIWHAIAVARANGLYIDDLL
jgi:hypothetical protein